MATKAGMKLIANNKKAFHDYFIEDTYEAGIALAGTEVKSLRAGKCSIKESFIRVEKGEVYIYGMHISPYEKGNIFNKDPMRVRKLLLHRHEINKIEGSLQEKGLTLVPLKVYFKNVGICYITIPGPMRTAPSWCPLPAWRWANPPAFGLWL